MKCNDQMLIAILESTEVADGEDAVAAQHLESCDSCQLRITQLAADQDSWHAAAEALNDQQPNTKTSIVIAVDRGLAPDMPVQAEHVSLDFLDPPSHPEMLGRIGRYDVERLIGAGGMGIVMKAYDTELHRPVAVKALAPHLAHSGGARQRFSREAQSAAAVVHENVVPIHNVDVDGKLPFLVMQFVDGESLQSRVERNGPLSPDEVLRLGKQIATGLAAAHAEGLVHRDVKPGNILLEQSVDRVLITDFGLARAADDASMTRSGVIAGTPHYMSPEQARGESIDIRSDLFGLGSVLYFMCTGHPPFRADGAMAIMHRICNDPHRPVDQVNEDVPADLAELIDQLLCKDTAKRPKDAQVVADTLTSLLHDKRSKTRFRKRKRKTMTSRQPWIAASCFIAITAFCIWWGFNQSQKPAPDYPIVSQGIPVQGDNYVAQDDTYEPWADEPLRDAHFSSDLSPAGRTYRFGDSFAPDAKMAAVSNQAPSKALRDFDRAFELPPINQRTPAPLPLFADVNFDMELEDLKTLITALENRE